MAASAAFLSLTSRELPPRRQRGLGAREPGRLAANRQVSHVGVIQLGRGEACVAGARVGLRGGFRLVLLGTHRDDIVRVARETRLHDLREVRQRRRPVQPFVRSGAVRLIPDRVQADDLGTRIGSVQPAARSRRRRACRRRSGRQL
jgi:hypothetical protein